MERHEYELGILQAPVDFRAASKQLHGYEHTLPTASSSHAVRQSAGKGSGCRKHYEAGMQRTVCRNPGGTYSDNQVESSCTAVASLCSGHTVHPRSTIRLSSALHAWPTSWYRRESIFRTREIAENV